MAHSSDYAIIGFGEEAVDFHHAMSFIGWKLVRVLILSPCSTHIMELRYFRCTISIITKKL